MKSIVSFLMLALIAGSALANGPAAKAAKPDLAKGEASFGAVCAACHAADGNSTTPVNPKLAQQHPEYLVKQLQEFKSGKRANAVMSGMVAALSDEDMRNIGFWLATKQAGNCKKSTDPAEAQKLLDMIDEIADIFKATKAA